MDDTLVPGHNIINDKLTTYTNATNQNEEDDLLDWDDEDFELGDIVLKKLPDSIPVEGQCEEETNDEDDWLEPPPQSAAREKTTTTTGAVYLTEQFRSLNTPASRKKSRCVQCTRPLMEGCIRLCHKCAPPPKPSSPKTTLDGARG